MIDGTDGRDFDAADDVLDLTLDDGDVTPEGDTDAGDGDIEESVIGFDDDEQEDEPNLVKKLREQLRQAQRQARTAKAPVQDNDPEPVVPVKKTLADFDYDQDRFDQYDDQRIAAIEQRADWKVRQERREAEGRRYQDEQTKRVEQQKRALGVSDYEAKAATVAAVLSEQQLAILMQGAEDPAKVIYALGRSEDKLAALAAEENLAKFATMLGRMEGNIKVMKRKAPAPETRVRGATAQISNGTDRELERLEKEAERTGDRSKVIAYRRSLRQQSAA